MDISSQIRDMGSPRQCGDWMSKNAISKMNDSDPRRALPAWAGSKRVLGVLGPGGQPRTISWPSIIASRLACRLRALRRRPILARTVVDDLTAAPRRLHTPGRDPGFRARRPAVAEWSYRAGEARITQICPRSARALAGLVVVIVENRRVPFHSATGMSVSLAPGSRPRRAKGRAAFFLKPSQRRGSAQVLPIGLPSLPYPTDRGNFIANQDTTRLETSPAGRRCWLPLLVSWDPQAPSQGRALAGPHRYRNNRETFRPIERSPCA